MYNGATLVVPRMMIASLERDDKKGFAFSLLEIILSRGDKTILSIVHLSSLRYVIL